MKLKCHQCDCDFVNIHDALKHEILKKGHKIYQIVEQKTVNKESESLKIEPITIDECNNTQCADCAYFLFEHRSRVYWDCPVRAKLLADDQITPIRGNKND